MKKQLMQKVFLLLLFIILSFPGFGQKIDILNFGKKVTIDSDYLSEETSFWYKLPKNFDKSKDSLSVLVLFDGDDYFGLAANVENLYQFADKMPATVIVALPSTVESRWKYYTPTHETPKSMPMLSNDADLLKLSGHFEEFANYVEKEVIGFLEKKYNADFVEKTIFGHSLGGLGVMSFYRYKPNVFENYICASPSLNWNDFKIISYYEEEYPKNTNDTRKIYFSSATPDANGYRENVEYLYNTLQEKISEPDKYVKYKNYKTEGHGTSGLRSLIDGMEFIYSSD